MGPYTSAYGKESELEGRQKVLSHSPIPDLVLGCHHLRPEASQPSSGADESAFSWRAVRDHVVIQGRWIWIGEIDTSNRLVVSCKSLCFCVSYVKRKRSKARHNNKKYFARLILLQGQLSVCHGSEHHCPTKRRPGNEWPNKRVLGSWQANMLVSFKNILS